MNSDDNINFLDSNMFIPQQDIFSAYLNANDKGNNDNL